MGTPLQDAKAHLTKAQEFLAAAESELDVERFNAATSNAVLSGVNSKDAICLKLTGATGKADDHKAAVPELARTGRLGAELAPTLERLLKLKTRAQYQVASMAKKDAESAVRWATQLYEAAERTVKA
jgi:uncharacterized protein (UPF0332 family)